MTTLLILSGATMLFLLAWHWLGGRAPADWGGFWLNGLHGFNRLFCTGYHRLDGTLLDLPGDSGVLLAANHAAGLDPMLIAAVSPRPIRFLVDREWYDKPSLSWMLKAMHCVPVDLVDRPQASFYEALVHLRQGEVVAIFPQGGLHPEGRLKRGVTKLAALSGVPVLPIYVSGVGSPGSVVRSILVRSHAVIRTFPFMTVIKGAEKEALQRLTGYLVQRPNPD